jgi:ribosomal protein S18 acetylase RimI-like enzyme
MDELRKASLEDLPAVQKVVADAYHHYIARLGKVPGPMSDDYEQLIVAECVWVLKVDNVVVGILVLVPESDHVLLNNVAIDPRFQGRGLGKRLIEHAELTATQFGVAELRLYTNVVMTEDLLLYRKLGFEETHRAKQDGYERVFMRKRMLPVQYDR